MMSAYIALIDCPKHYWATLIHIFNYSLFDDIFSQELESSHKRKLNVALMGKKGIRSIFELGGGCL